MFAKPTIRWAVRCVIATAPLALLLLVACWFRWVPADRPILMLMLFTALIAVSVSSGAVALMVAVQLKTQEAFAAGFVTGAASVFPGDRETAPRRRRGDPLLRLLD